MPLINDVHTMLVRLAPRGWGSLLKAHGLDVGVPVSKLAAELARPLVIDRTQPGFEEFALAGTRGVEPAIPGRSLLYHALASPDVLPLTTDPVMEDFPTLEELDALENYIYSAARHRLSSFTNPVLAVMAYQYREKALSPHRRHADLCFSRTGVARVGNEPPRYDAAQRGFDPRPAQGDRGFAPLPARYALFVAEYRTPTASDQVLRPVSPDATQIFLFPMHKVFPGDECLWSEDGSPLAIAPLDFAEFHINEKLRRMHLASPDNPGRVAPLALFDINQPPFRRVTPSATDLVSLQAAGASVLTMPVPNAIVRTDVQRVGEVDEIARFRVPAAASNNRFWSSLMLRSIPQKGRAAPEYANMRQQVVRPPGGPARILDMNRIPDSGTVAAERFDAKLAAGGFEAAHFVDGTCDGVVSCAAPAALAPLMMFPAYSLVTAVDYFPQLEQVEILEWIESLSNAPVGLGRTDLHFAQGGPEPLSDGRFRTSATGVIRPTRRIPNPVLIDPAAAASGVSAFAASEAASRSVTAVVGRAATAGSAARVAPGRFGTTWLPDAASDVFAPGWDVSQHVIGQDDTYASYGLGSPFPEDAKLCAALNSFWPAAAPDSSRTYGFHPGSDVLLRTSIPLTDGELGYNPGHPRVVSGEQGSSLGWDGDTGPFLFSRGDSLWVNASNPERADETRAALDGQLGFSGLDRLTTVEAIDRMEALRFCRDRVLSHLTSSPAWLVTVEAVPDWAVWSSAVQPPMTAALNGPGLLFEFVECLPTPVPVGDPPLRLSFEVLTRVEIQLDGRRAFVRENGGPVSQFNRP